MKDQPSWESTVSMSQDKKSAKHHQPPVATSESFKSHPTYAELKAEGKSLRDKCPREAHAVWKPGPNRRDPIHLLEESSKGRIPELIPIRYGRMIQSPFAFYRGTALNMAADLATTCVSGLRVQACGDCHLCNFGAFATPERRVICDINDLDETLPAPWEWDVKRLAASFVVASRFNGHSEAEARDAALACVRSYRENMAEYSKMRVLDVWYAFIDFEKLIEATEEMESQKRLQKRLAKARERSVAEHDFPELVTTAGLKPTIKENPPLIFHPRHQDEKTFEAMFEQAFATYRASLSDDKRMLLDRYKLVDFSLKVVGVGSVGTVCGVMLLMASEKDPLFLQFKQARESVLEPYAGKSVYANHGQRVVVGQRLMQSASDLFLGWTEGQMGRHFYIRQLKDMKIKPLVEIFTPSVMRYFGALCGHILARSHARSGQPAKITGYLGKSDVFDKAIADFAVAYADQAEQDHEAMVEAVRGGRLEVFIEGT
jgi:uncharacterized protein (DUF2252 family)